MIETEETLNIYIAQDGNDDWSGRLKQPAADKKDGPLATIAGAKAVVRNLKETGQLPERVKVWLREGIYQLDHTLIFRPEDAAPVTYASYPGEEAVISGGMHVSDWDTETVSGHTVWTKKIQEVEDGDLYFHQLFVNGERRQRSRLPKEGFYWMKDVPDIDLDAELFDGSNRFVCESGDVQQWKNLNDVEIVVLHYWTEDRLPISNFDPETGMVTSERKSIFSLKDDFKPRYAKYFVDNVFEGLSEPGEWYLDRETGKLYYIPLPGENMEEVEVIVPVINQFISLQGDYEQENYVEYIHFNNLKFRYADWYQPPGGGEKFGYPDQDFGAAPQAAFNVPGTIKMTGAKNCAFVNCAIKNIGWYGLEIGEGCCGNRIAYNEITDMGAGGIKIGGSGADGDVLARTGNNRITDNHIHDGGHVFYAGVGVLMIHTFGNHVAHNHIHDLYYSGISCGWVWGYAENVSKENKIIKNYIHDLGKGVLNDMGGIYTLGIQPGTVIKGNVIHDVQKANYGGWGIYLDEGSSHILVENNLSYHTSSQAFNQHYGRENIIRNNIFALAREGQVSLSRAENHIAFNFFRNVVITDGQPVYQAGYAGELDQKKIISDLNLLWDVSGKEIFASNSKEQKEILDKEKLQELGYECNSIFVNPQFKVLASNDFKLAQDSPAKSIGFKPFNIDDAGVRE